MNENVYVRVEMTKVPWILFLFACFVSSGWTYAQSHYVTAAQPVTRKVNYENGIRENFKNLFDSVGKNDTKKSGSYLKILKQEIGREQQAFEEMKNKLQIARYRNLHTRRRSFQRSNVGEGVVVVKREMNGTTANNHTLTNATKDDLFTPEEFATLYNKGVDELRAAVRERFQKKLNKTIEEKNEKIDQRRISEDYNKVVCAIMLIRWHVADEFKENVIKEKEHCNHANESNQSICLWTTYIKGNRTKVASSLQQALGSDDENYNKFALSMIKMYKLCDAYMRTLPDAMRIIKEYEVNFKPVDDMLQTYGLRGPSHQFLRDDMTYVNMLLTAREVVGIGWYWVDEKNGVVKPDAPLEGCVNPFRTEKPLMY